MYSAPVVQACISTQNKYFDLFSNTRKTQHLEELSSTVTDYADAVNLLTLNVCSSFSFRLRLILSSQIYTKNSIIF